MASVVDIANYALEKLGEAPITSLSDGSTRSNVMNLTWPLVRRYVLQNHPWNDVITRKVLAPNTTAPTFGYTYAYNLPSDCLRVLQVSDPNNSAGFAGENTRFDYLVEGGAILTNRGPALNLRYIKDEEDTSVYRPALIKAISSYWAMEVAEKFTQSNSKKEYAARDFMASLVEAAKTDALEKPSTKLSTDSWLLARH
jgi:hypothetical protein